MWSETPPARTWKPSNSLMHWINEWLWWKADVAKNKSISSNNCPISRRNCNKQILSSLRIIRDEIILIFNCRRWTTPVFYTTGLYHSKSESTGKLKDMARILTRSPTCKGSFFWKENRGFIHHPQHANPGGNNEPGIRRHQCIATLVNSLSIFLYNLYSWYIQHGHARMKRT